MSEATVIQSSAYVGSEPDDRRVSTRYPCGRKCVCWPIGQGSYCGFWAAKVRDISTAGICLLINRSFEPGTVLVVEMDETADDDSRLLLARIARRAERKRGGYVLGCSLTMELSDHDLMTLLPFPSPRESSDGENRGF